MQPKATGVRHHVVFHHLNLVGTEALAQGFSVKVGTAATDVDLGDPVLCRVEPLQELGDRRPGLAVSQSSIRIHRDPLVAQVHAYGDQAVLDIPKV